MSVIRDRLARASSWLAAAKLMSGVLSAAGTVILARLLVPADFGIVALAASFIAVAASLTELSLGSALINVEEPEADHLHTVWTLNLARAAFLTAGFCLAAHPLALLLGDTRLEPVLYALSASLALTGMISPRLSLLERDLRFRQAFTLTLCSTLAGFAVSVALGVMFRSYWALVAGTLAGQVVRVGVSFAVAPYWPKLRLTRARELWRFSAWLSLSQIASTLNYRADQLIVGWHLGRAELGFYTVGGQLAQLPGREVVAPLTAALFPALSLVRGDADRSRSGYLRAQTLTTAVALPVTMLVALFAHPLVLLLLGPQWVGAVPVIQFVAAATAFETLGSLVGPLAMAQGQTKVLFHRDMLKLGLRLPLIVAGLLLGGFPGLLAGRSLAGVLGIFIDMTLVRTITSLPLGAQLWANRRCLIATGVMAVVAVTLQRLVPAPEATWEQWARLVLLGGASLGAMVLTTVLLWRRAGFAEGPEREMAELTHSVLKAARA